MTQGAHHHAASHCKQAYHRPHTALGATGHWIREAGILAPLIISEFVKDPQRQWRYIRMASIATALLSQGMWTTKIHKEREATREHELMCHSQG